MKTWLLAATAVVALAGCKAQNETPAPAPSASAETAAPVASATSQAIPGTYDVTDAKGTKTTTMIMADGTYMDQDASGKTTAKGKWDSPTDMHTCFTPDNGGKKVCYTESKTAADGTFTVTPDDNSGTLTVRKRA